MNSQLAAAHSRIEQLERENARLLAETKEALDQQAAVSEVLRKLSGSAFDLEEVLDTILEQAIRLTGAEHAIAAQGDGDDVRVLRTAGDPPTVTVGSHMPPDSTIGGAVAKGQTVHDLDLARKAAPARLVVPVKHEDRPTFVIAVGRQEPRPFGEREIALVRTFADQAVIAIENVRQFNETREALDRQTAISDILRVISGSPKDVQPVLDAIAASARRFCQAEDASVILWREGDMLEFAAHDGLLQGRTDAEEPWQFDRTTVSGRSMLEGRPIHVHDLLAEPDEEYPTGKAQARRYGHRTTLAAPLLREGRALGALLLRRGEVRPFSETQVDLVRTFAAQAVIAIENVRFFNETREALEQQTATSEVLQAISRSAFDLQSVLDTVVERAAQLCGAEQAWMRRLAGDEFRFVAYYGASDHLRAMFEDIRTGRVRDDRRVDHSGMGGRAVRARRPIHVHDIAADPELRDGSLAKRGGARTALAVPMLREGEPIGAIVVARNREAPFNEREIRLVETFSDQAVIAIENVRLFNETKEALAQQTAVSDVLATISQSPGDIAPVLETVMRRAMALCGSDDVLVLKVEADEVRVIGHLGPVPTGALAPIKLANTPPAAARAIGERGTIHIADLLDYPEDEYAAGRRLAVASGVRTSLAVPLLRKGAAIGAIVLRRLEVRPFADTQIALLETFADQAAIAIENVRLFNETREALEQQTAVAGVLQSMSRSAFDLQRVLETLVEQAARLCDAERGSIHQLEGDVYRTTAFWGDISDEYRRLALDTVRRPGRETLIGRTALERKVIHLPDVLADPEYQANDIQKVGGYRTMLGVPLLREGVPIGVFVLTRQAVRPFTDRQIALVQTFADQAVIAIENIRLFEEIRDKSAQLEVASRHKSEFLANMSHELRTPLNAIIGFSEVLLQGMFGEINPKQREYLDDVLSSGRHLLSLINDILDLAKIEAGRVELELAEFSLATALENGLTMVRERAARHGIRLDLEIGHIDRIVADERKVKQVLFNLLSNAVKFTPEGGRVAVRAASHDGEVHVAVRDTGIGIDAADQERIFEEFQQAGRDPERSREGTGLGLALARRYVELHGGRLWVESEPGRGSTFTFALPLRKEG